jgi:hypothetical protein
MNTRTKTWRGAALRALWSCGIVLAGLISLVGSGGGLAIGFPPCDAPWCDSTPPPPLMGVTVQPPYLTLQVGSTGSLTVRVSNATGPLTYQWLHSADGGSFSEIPGANTTNLVLPAVNLALDGHVYRVRVTAGDGTMRFGDARLAVSSAPGIVIQDGEFALGNWQASARENPPGVFPAHTETQDTIGGNPGAWLRMVYQIPAGAGAATVNYLRNGAFYDPRLSGAIYVIDYAEDCRVLQSSDIQSAESHLVFEQAGRRYAAIVSNICNATAWGNVASRNSLAASNFTVVGGPSCAATERCPDFSAAAQPLQFGFRRFVWGAPGDVIGHGIDNWKVTVWRR